MGAGAYWVRYRHFVWTPEVNLTNGQEVPAWVESGYLWGSLDETAGRRGNNYGATQTGSDAEIRIRNYPDISALDQLEDTFGVRWQLETTKLGDNETICDAHKLDSEVTP